MLSELDSTRALEWFWLGIPKKHDQMSIAEQIHKSVHAKTHKWCASSTYICAGNAPGAVLRGAAGAVQ